VTTGVGLTISHSSDDVVVEVSVDVAAVFVVATTVVGFEPPLFPPPPSEAIIAQKTKTEPVLA
jgi:hypothetical protein